MLEKPDLHDATLIAGLRDAYGIVASQVTFLPVGADQATAAYRVLADDGTVTFLKLRRGAFDTTLVTLPEFLRAQGLEAIIVPLRTVTGQLWADLGAYTMILYPFIEGRNGFEVVMTPHHWIEFGRALKRLHTIDVTAPQLRQIRRETYAPRWREALARLLRRVANGDLPDLDPVGERAAAFLSDRHAETLHLVRRTESLARRLRARSPDYVLCHADAHAGNVLIDASGAFYIVDWDDPTLAPKERDLMFVGGAQGFLGYSPEQEEALFYRGYGATQIDPVALAYYRYARIVEDIAIYGEQLLLSHAGGQDREQSLIYLKANYESGGTIEAARRADRTPR